MNAMTMLERPMLTEARVFCQEREISPEELERVRLSMCSREFKLRMRPWWSMLANVMAYEIGPPSASYLRSEAIVREVAIAEMQRLGLDVCQLQEQLHQVV